MSSERTDVWSANEPSAGGTAGTLPFAILGTDFIEVLALFVRTIPLYPDGHGRVIAVSARLEETAAALRESQVIEVADRGLIVNGKERAELPPGPTALREAMLATAVVRVTFEATTPAASYVAFARTLQRNARMAGSAHLAFADLWNASIPGIEVEELVFGVEGFAGDGSERTVSDALEVLGSWGEGSGRSGDAVPGSTESTAGHGTEGPASDDVFAPVRPKPRVMRTVSRDLRELVLEDPALATSLVELETHLRSDGARPSASGADVLEHLVRALPIEARLDALKGVEVVRRVLARLLAKLPEAPPADSTPDLQTRFFQTLESVFPKRVLEPPAANTATSAPELKSGGSPFDDLLVLDDSVLDEWSGARDAAPAPIPELVTDDGIRDSSGLLLHALLEEPAGARRDALHKAVLVAYAARPKSAAPPCILTHLAEALAAPVRDSARVTLLAGLVDEAELEFRSGVSPITFEVAVSLFPLCFSTYVRSGGRAGAVARRVGREAILAAAPRLAAAGGALTGDCLDRLLADRSFDVLPFVEALLVADASMRSRAVRALRVLDLKSLAAVALRVVPDNRFTDRFLRGLCSDGFAGLDSKGLIAEAAVALGSVVLDKEGVLDMKTRIYATAALGSFPMAFAEPSLRAVTARKLIGAAPKELRRAAEDVLERLARAAADARPVP